MTPNRGGRREGVAVVVEQLRRGVPGGIGRYAHGLLDGLRELGGPPVALVASRLRGSGPDPLGAWGFPVLTSALPAPFLTAAWDRGFAPVRGARLVHAVSLAVPPVRPHRRDDGTALVVTVHDLAWRTHPEATTPRGRRWHEAALQRALGHADAFVVPAAAVAADLVAAGASPDRVRVIVHGVDHLPAPDFPGATALLGRLGIDGEYLLAAATLEPRKNLRGLVAAYARARRSLARPWPLVVVGPRGWGDTGLDGAAAEGVVVAGAVDDGVLAALYARARAFAYVPLTEGFGLPPLEAMACGTPVVASVTVPSTAPGGLSPTASGPGAGASSEAAALRVDPCTLEEVAAALVRAAGDDAVRSALVAAGRDLVAPLTWQASARAHASWWESIA